MKKKNTGESSAISLRVLKRKLRNLPNPDAPQNLQCLITKSVPKCSSIPYINAWRARARHFSATAAAAVIIFISLATVNYTLSTPSMPQELSLSGPIFANVRSDYNSYLFDLNSTFVGNFLSH